MQTEIEEGVSSAGRFKDWASFLAWWRKAHAGSSAHAEAAEDVLPSGGLWGVKPPTAARVARALQTPLQASRDATEAALAAAAAGDSVDDTPCHGTTQLVAGLQRFLFAHAARALFPPAAAAAATDGGDGDADGAGGDADAAAATEAAAGYEAALCMFGRQLLRACSLVLDSAIDKASVREEARLKQLDVALRQSVVGQLLPLFATALSWFVSRLPVAVMLLPEITKVARQLDAIADALPEVCVCVCVCVAGDHAFEELSRCHLPDPEKRDRAVRARCQARRRSQ